jgi:DNA-binding Xre family transcriptional regulator
MQDHPHEYGISEEVLFSPSNLDESKTVMEHDPISVRKLTAAAGVSPTIIQGLRSGSRTNITIDTLSKILGAVGYQIIFTSKAKSERIFKAA